MNYNKLIKANPTVFDTLVNSLGQTIKLVEHPTKGDEAEVICMCDDLKLAAYSGFFETADMMADHKEYEPSFRGGQLWIGDTLAD